MKTDRAGRVRSVLLRNQNYRVATHCFFACGNLLEHRVTREKPQVVLGDWTGKIRRAVAGRGYPGNQFNNIVEVFPCWKLLSGGRKPPSRLEAVETVNDLAQPLQTRCEKEKREMIKVVCPIDALELSQTPLEMGCGCIEFFIK